MKRKVLFYLSPFSPSPLYVENPALRPFDKLRVVTVRLRSLSLSKVEGSEVEPPEVGERGIGGEVSITPPWHEIPKKSFTTGNKYFTFGGKKEFYTWRR